MRNRKAFSELIVTILIVLLTVAAVGIVWSFISPSLLVEPQFKIMREECREETKTVYITNTSAPQVHKEWYSCFFGNGNIFKISNYTQYLINIENGLCDKYYIERETYFPIINHTFVREVCEQVEVDELKVIEREITGGCQLSKGDRFPEDCFYVNFSQEQIGVLCNNNKELEYLNKVIFL